MRARERQLATKGKDSEEGKRMEANYPFVLPEMLPREWWHLLTELFIFLIN
jgi:hypothetical protein